MSEIVLPATIAEALAAHTYLARVAAGCLRREVVVHGEAGFAVGDAVEIAVRPGVMDRGRIVRRSW